MVRLVIALLVSFIAPAFASEAPDPRSLLVLPDFAIHGATLSSSGKLQSSDLGAIARAGIRHVIDLRLDSETPDFDEAAAVHDAGMQYHALPIGGAQDLTLENVARFDRLIAEVGDQATLVHCSSSNRVGAMQAMRAAWIQGKPVEAALAEGRSWGLKGLEAEVRKRLAASPVAN